MSELTKDNKLSIPIEEEMKNSYLDYAMSVIVSRAIPDVRDGLKPVHRRILYSMYESGYSHDKAYRKSARIVGDVMGKYHPHGDAAIYDSLVRMAQDFSLRLPLIDGQGNFGSIDGDSPAAMRYTESRLAKPTSYILSDLDKETVEFRNNYDGSEKEPCVLPSMIPSLLVNGTSGIAVGMATNIPSHNLGEVIDILCSYIDNNDITIEEMMEIMPGPDFPTSGIIMGKGGIHSAYHTGRGSIIIRGVATLENVNNKEQIIISEIPYGVNKVKLIEKIAELVKDKKIEGITDIRDESNKKGIRVVIEVRRDVNGEVLLNHLYQYTQLQVSFGVIMLALDNNLPRIMNLKDIVKSFINFREEVISKRTIFLLNKARIKAHLLLGLSIAVRNIDEVIKVIKSSSDSQKAKTALMERLWDSSDILDLIDLIDEQESLDINKKFSFSEKQAKAILEMRLQRLTAMEKGKIEDDLKATAKLIQDYLAILSSKDKLFALLKSELLEMKEKFATPRLTEISNAEINQDIEDLIQREDMVVTYTIGGYIKRSPLSVYRSQNRGGKGRTGIAMKSEDITKNVFVGSTHTPLLFFSNLGQVYSLKLYKLPVGSPQSKGRNMVNILPMAKNEYITTIIPLPEDEAERNNLNIVFATRKGQVRKNSLLDFNKIQANGKIAIRMDKDDSLVDVCICDEQGHIFLATSQGKATRFPADKLRVFKSRTSDGVRGMKLADNDFVISMTILDGAEYSLEEREEFLSIPFHKRVKVRNGKNISIDSSIKLDRSQIDDMAKSEELILSISTKGYGKITSSYGYRITNRGGSGVINMITTQKTGDVVCSMPVRSVDDIMLITDAGRVIRCKLDKVRVTGRSTQGVILFKTPDNEKIVSCALVEENNEE